MFSVSCDIQRAATYITIFLCICIRYMQLSNVHVHVYMYMRDAYISRLLQWPLLLVTIASWLLAIAREYGGE